MMSGRGVFVVPLGQIRRREAARGTEEGRAGRRVRETHLAGQKTADQDIGRLFQTSQGCINLA